MCYLNLLRTIKHHPWTLTLLFLPIGIKVAKFERRRKTLSKRLVMIYHPPTTGWWVGAKLHKIFQKQNIAL